MSYAGDSLIGKLYAGSSPVLKMYSGDTISWQPPSSDGTMYVAEFTGAGGVGNTVSGVPFRPGVMCTFTDGANEARLWATETTAKYDDMWSWTGTSPLTGFGTINADGWSGDSTYWTTSGTNYQVFHWPSGVDGGANNLGTITSETFVNGLAGVSCGRYFGNGNATATFGHGLGFTPCLVLIWGDCTDIRNGRLYSPTFGPYQLGTWNEAGGEAGANGIVSVNANTVEISDILAVNEVSRSFDFVAFRDVPGKIASGTVNGDNVSTVSVTGLGFEPRLMFLLGNDGTGDTGGTYIFTLRTGQTAPYFANYRHVNTFSTPDPQPVSTDVQFLADGFSIEPGYRGNNGSQATYIAFA